MTTEMELPSAARAVERLGQATAVEQSRAVAEVQAAVIVARQFPRDVQRAMRELADVCGEEALASRAFFRYGRAGSNVTGPSVHLARAVAACWGNIDYGISEMRQDLIGGESEMKAWAWDMERNVRDSNTFIVPHTRDTKQGTKKITDSRDVYENNANQGARRVRECIFALVPSWFVEKAKDMCNKTLKEGGGIPLPQRIATAIENFAKLGVSVDQLESKLERPNAKWTDQDVATLWVIGKSLQNGETSREEEFPPVRVTVEELSAPPAAANGASKPAAPPFGPAEAAATLRDAAPDSAEGVSREQLDALNAALATVGVNEGVDRLATVSKLAGIPQLSTTSNLTATQAGQVIATLERLGQRPEPARELDVYLANLDEGEAQS